MTNFETPKTTGSGVGCGKLFGYGCLGIVALGWLGASALAGSPWMALLVLAITVVLLVAANRSKKRAYASVAENSTPLAEDSYLETPTPMPSDSVSASTGWDDDPDFANPICEHTFGADQVDAGGFVTCACGNTFSTANLNEYRRLSQQLVKTYDSLEALEAKMRDGVNQPGRVAAATAAVVPAPIAAPKVVKPKIERPKRELSLAQWLIIGASVLVMVAGSIFVAQNMQFMEQWQFMLIAGGVGLATGFGAFKTRNFSVMLANFLAAFSSAMQLAMMSMIADQTSPAGSWEWNSMPPIWWAISLFAVSAAATLLAKLSNNFAWKGIAVLSLAGASMTLVLGELMVLPFAGIGVTFSVLLLTAVASLAQARYLRNLPQPEVKDKALAAYAKDLAEREGKSLSVAGRGAAALQVVAALGLTVMSVGSILTLGENPLSLLLLAAVWVPLGFTKKFWIEQISDDKAVLAKLDTVASSISYFSVLLAGLSLVRQVDLAQTSTLLEVLAFIGIPVLALFVSPLFKQYAPKPVILQAGFWVAAIFWLIPNALQLALIREDFAQSLALVLFGLAFAASDLKLGSKLNNWPSQIANALGALTLMGWVASNLEPDNNSTPYVLASLGLVLLANIQVPIRRFIERKQQVASNSIQAWMSFAVSAAVTLVMLAIPGIDPAAGPSQNGALIAVFTVYAIVAQALGIWGPLKKNFSKVLQAHGYLGQSVTLFSVLAVSSSFHGLEHVADYAALIAMLALINYAFGTVAKSTLRMQLGFGAALVAFFAQQWAAGTGTLAPSVTLQVAVVAAASWLHGFLLRKRSSASAAVLSYTPVAGVFAGLLLTSVTNGTLISSASANEIYLVDGVLAMLAIASTFVSELSRTAKVETRATALRAVAIIYAAWALFASAISSRYLPAVEGQWRVLPALLLLAVIVLRLNAKRNHIFLLLAGYVLTITVGLIGGLLIQDAIGRSDIEILALAVSAALIVTTLITGKQSGKARRLLIWDIPVLGTAGLSYVASIVYASDMIELRQVLSLGLIAGYAYLRSAKSAPELWLAAGYLTGGGAAFNLGRAMLNWGNISVAQTELVSLLVALSILVGNRFFVRRLGDKLKDLRYSLVVGSVALPVFFAGYLGWPSDSPENYARRIGALALLAGFALWRIGSSKPLPWSVASYVLSAGFALSVGQLLSSSLLPGFEGPELYSVLLAGSALLVHRFALMHLKFKSSLFSWGLPLALALVPSTLFTYTALTTPFENLDGLQITRVVVVLLASIALLVLGLRRGNLAMATMGVVGLGLMLVPNTAMRGGELSIETTALVIGALLFTLLALFKQAGKLKGNSMLFIGLPISLFLAPSLVTSLLALADPLELSGVDWWRFGIVLTAGMTLLIVGALRELGGMFYPGLISVLLSALPYGFKPTREGEWFLWVLLLLVAAVMIWLALRLERLRKQGRGSSEWFRELK